MESHTYHHLCLVVCILFITQHIGPSTAYLSTSGRWIVDEDGQRVKLTCGTWPSHLQPVVAEGLSKQPAAAIVKKIKEMGFNCVRLTFPLDLATNDTLAHNVTVRQSFQSLGLNDDVVGIQQHNPDILDLPLIEALKNVVGVLGENGVMVVLDNHVTVPGWCCSDNDGNGFFGDRFFDPTAWVAGWEKMAGVFNGVSNVVGMSLRNELRGPRQNVTNWYTYMQQGAEAIHSANPNVLVVFSGFGYDTDLSFVRNQPVRLSFKRKLVFEIHTYSWANGMHWDKSNANDMCSGFLLRLKNAGGFLLEKKFPLFMSEFGIDERGGNMNDNRFISCLLTWLADNDLDWSLWSLQGSYYLRQGAPDAEEMFGILAKDWISVRNQTFLQRLSLVQSTLGGPGSQTELYNIVFHPLTGLCLARKSPSDPSLVLGQCNQTEKWSYEEKSLKIQGQSLCLKTDEPGKPVRLDSDCSGLGSKWKPLSRSHLHLSSKPTGSSTLCLDVDGSNNVISNACKCLWKDSSCDPVSQWFKIVRASKNLYV